MNLTGKVNRIGPAPFATGGLADIWMGTLYQESQAPRLVSAVKMGTDAHLFMLRCSAVFLQVAIKVVRNYYTEPKYVERRNKKLQREGKVWSRLDHPSITPFLGVSFDAGQPDSPALICPFYKNSHLIDYLKTNPQANPVAMLVQAASGLEYLHSLKPNAIVHGDIKASNILVNDDGHACLADFGLSRILDTRGFTTKSVGGTCRWMAYELLAPSEDEDDEELPVLTKASDVWAFGMTILEAVTCNLPFEHLKYDATVILTVIKGALPLRPAMFSEYLWTLLQYCWSLGPEARPSIKAVERILRDYAKNSSLPPANVHRIVERCLLNTWNE